MTVLTAPDDTTATGTTTVTAASTADVAELLDAAGRGSGAAWEELVRRYGGWVSAVVRSYRLQDADARDAEQRTWLRLLENHHRIREPERLGGWLATTAGRECLAMLRERRAVTDLLDADTVVDAATSIEQQVVDADTAARLWDLVDLLPERPRTVVRALFSDDPLAYAEIARATGIPVGSLGPTRARVLERLRRMFEGSLVDRPIGC